MSDTFKDINEWFRLAIPNPTKDNQRVQAAVFFEECAEFFDTVNENSNTFYDELITDTNYQIKKLSDKMKTQADFMLSINDRKEFLDALCDIIVTVIGTGHVYGFDMLGALDAVSKSNNSKFVDGKPIFNAQNKIAKGHNYHTPFLDSFVGKNPVA